MIFEREMQARKRGKHLWLLAFVAATILSCASTNTQHHSNNYKSKKNQSGNMKNVLIIGMNPHTMDFSNPEIPKGLTIEMVEKGTKATLDKLNSLGYNAELYLIDAPGSDLSKLAKQLKDKNYSGVVVGNGIRGLPSNFLLFEQLVNIIHSNAPASRIIFNTLPTNTDEAVKRWL